MDPAGGGDPGALLALHDAAARLPLVRRTGSGTWGGGMHSCRRLRGERAVPQARLPRLDRRFRGREQGREGRGARRGLEWLLRVTGRERDEPRGTRVRIPGRGGGVGSGRRLLGRGRGERPLGAVLSLRELRICACVGVAQEVVPAYGKPDPEAPSLCVTGKGGAKAVGGTSQLVAKDHRKNPNANPGWGPSGAREQEPRPDVR